MKTTFFRAIVCLALIFCVLAGAACPKKDAIRKSAEASYRLPGVTNDVIAAVKEGREKRIFSPELSAKFGDYLGQMAKAELSFVEAVRAADAVYQKTGSIPAGDLAKIRLIFDNEIVAPFVKVLELYNVLSGGSAALLTAAIGAVRVVLSTIGSGFGSTVLRLITKADPIDAAGPANWRFA
jgi:hypothetical protein